MPWPAPVPLRHRGGVRVSASRHPAQVVDRPDRRVEYAEAPVSAGSDPAKPAARRP